MSSKRSRRRARGGTGSQRAQWLAGGAVLLVGVAVVGWLAWPEAPSSPAPRARQYTNFDACLLTGSGGIASTAAAPVWAGMQSASAKTLAKVSFLSVVGPDTADNAATYLNTLITRHCDVVLAVGPAEVSALVSQASQNPTMHFVAVADGPGAANVATVAVGPDDAVRRAVDALITKAVGGSFAGGPANSS